MSEISCRCISLQTNKLTAKLDGEENHGPKRIPPLINILVVPTNGVENYDPQ